LYIKLRYGHAVGDELDLICGQLPDLGGNALQVVRDDHHRFASPAQQHAARPGAPGQLPGGLGSAKAVFNMDVRHDLRPVGGSPFNRPPVVAEQQVGLLRLDDLPEGTAVGQGTAFLHLQRQRLPVDLRTQAFASVKAVVHGGNHMAVTRAKGIGQLYKPRLLTAQGEGGKSVEQDAGCLR